MSVKCSEATIVKEEYEILEYDADLKEAYATEDKSKCGEVFLVHRKGDFIFVCAQCQQTFTEFHSFGEHIRDDHPLFDIETILPVAFDGDMLPPKLESSGQHISDIGLHIGLPREGNKKMEVDAPVYDAHCKGDDQSEEPQFGTSKESSKTFTCKPCNITFIEFESYRRHYTGEHPDMIKIDDNFGNSAEQKSVPSEMCKYCLQNFNDKPSYLSHMKNAHTDRRYICPYCPKTFPLRLQRNYHVDTHEGKKPHKCPHCASAFTRRGSLNEHVKFMHMITSLQFTCRFCDKKFKRQSELKRHEAIHTVEIPLGCNECDMKFGTKRQLHNHMRIHYKCSHCDKAFTSSALLEEHLLMLRNEQTWMCKYCSKTFDDEATYHCHVESDHPNQLYICPYCPKSFTRSHDKNIHVDTHEGRKPHKCPHCDSAFTRRGSLNQHVRFIHKTSSLEFTCRFCNKIFKRKFILRRHEQIHTEERTEKTVGCSECGMKFWTESHLRSHMRKHYNCSHCDKAFYSSTMLEEHLLMLRNEKTWLCKYCSKTFDDEATYHGHVESDHPNQQYNCPYCPKSFTHSHQKNMHVDSHEGRKPHKCPHCPSAFSRRNSLNEHVRFIHKTSSLDFTCRFCNKKFKRKCELTRHEKLHTAEETVECNECDMKFRNKRKLHNHMLLKHYMAQKNYKCTHCDKAFHSSTLLEEHLLTHSDERPLNANIGEHIETKDKSLSQSDPGDNFPSLKSEPDGEEVDS